MSAQAVRLSNVDIDEALKNKDFEVLFQPIFDLGNGALARVESFVRWRHPSLGVLPPGAFISFFETQGRMSELTRYVLDEALGQYMNWRGPFQPGFSINLALSDLADEAFPSHLTVLLRDAGFPPDCVTLECPMPPVAAELDVASKQFQRLAATGARLAIEVRGRANDFLKQVRPFPFVEIKTGGAAILRFARTVRGPGLSAISELLELATEHNAVITAVGVEDQASLSALRGLGFAAAQGNHLSRVSPLNQFTPSRVNEVRDLLGLEALSKDDLAALFRTGSPVLPTAAPSEVSSPRPPGDDKVDDLVERLAARIAQVEGPTTRPPPAPAIAKDEEARPARSKRARPEIENAHHRREAAEEKRKSAAIARARKRTEYRESLATKKPAPEDVPADDILPRRLQDRLTREFEAFADAGEPPTQEASPKPDPAPKETAPPVGPDEFEFAEEAAALDASPPAGEATAETEAPAAAEEQPPALERKSAFGSARAEMKGVPARFVPAIRIAAPELTFASPTSLQAAPPPPEPQEARSDIVQPTTPAGEQTAAPAREESVAHEAPEPEPGEPSEFAWLKDSIALAEAAEPARRRKNFLTRTVVRFPKYFWPRPVRRWMQTSARQHAAE